MKAIEVFQKVQNEGCQLARPRKNCLGEYDAKFFAEGGKKKGWVYVDAVTANAVLTVYKACNEQQKQKFESLGLIGMVNFAWKCIA